MLGGCSLTTSLDDLRGDPDGSTSGDGGLCSGEHILCEDFDDGGWSSSWIAKSQSATLSVATDDFVSPPASLLLAATASDAQGILLGAFPAAVPGDFTCSVWVNIQGFPNGYDLRVSPIYLYDVGDPALLDYEIGFRGYDEAASVNEHVQTADGGWVDNGEPLTLSVVNDGWQKLTMSVHLGASPSATISVSNGAFAAMLPLSPPADVSGVAFGVGISYAGSSDGWTAHFDDAVCDAK